MKQALLFLFLISSMVMDAQVSVKQGPNLQNDRDNKMNRMVYGDENGFYCYRVRSRGKGTSYNIEKYSKDQLKPIFSKEINIEDEKEAKMEDVEYAGGKVYIFRRQYDKDADKMTLYYQTVSSTGVVAPKQIEIMQISTDHYEFIDFDIYPNPSRTKFLVKASHKANKEAEWTTDFVLYDADGMKKIWTKSVNKRLASANTLSFGSLFLAGIGVKVRSDLGFIGMMIDDKDNVYYASLEDAKNSTEKERKYRLWVYTMASAATTPVSLEVPFEEDYLVSDIKFRKTGDNELSIGGFLKDVIERRGRDLVKCGIFSARIDVAANKLTASTVKMFDDKILAALESNAKRSRYFKYKLDYIFPIGGDVYFVGEQYEVEQITRTGNSYGGMNSTTWHYTYMDVIIAKLNTKGEFEWIKNAPMREEMSLSFPHVFKQYIAVATDSKIYILGNEHPKNIEIYKKPDFEPKDIKSVSGIHGSNFACSTFDIPSGNMTHEVVFKNEDYCFAPIQERNPQFIPPSDTEIFVNCGGNDYCIYTEDAGRDRFATMSFK